MHERPERSSVRRRRRVRDVVRAGNQDFEKVYSSVFDFIVNHDAEGLAAYRTSMAALECPGAAARPQRGGTASLEDLYRDAARARRRAGNGWCRRVEASAFERLSLELSLFKRLGARASPRSLAEVAPRA